jgi:hypothetical protein
MNMPELLSWAVNSKSGIAISKHQETQTQAEDEVGNLKARLSYWTNVLKAPEED